MQRLEKEDRLTYTKSGRVYEKRYLDESVGVPAQSIWSDISFLRGMGKRQAASEWLDGYRHFWDRNLDSLGAYCSGRRGRAAQGEERVG